MRVSTVQGTKGEDSPTTGSDDGRCNKTQCLDTVALNRLVRGCGSRPRDSARPGSTKSRTSVMLDQTDDRSWLTRSAGCGCAIFGHVAPLFFSPS